MAANSMQVYPVYKALPTHKTRKLHVQFRGLKLGVTLQTHQLNIQMTLTLNAHIYTEPNPNSNPSSQRNVIKGNRIFLASSSEKRRLQQQLKYF